MEDLVKQGIYNLDSNKIFYVGNPDSDELARIYSHCDVGISAYAPDSMVSLPIKAFHYSAAGLAIINSLEGDFCRLLADSGSGIQYKSQSPKSLASAIKWYCDNPKILFDTKKASSDLGLKFDSEYQYAKIANLINRL
jgi:glycosyltransferase involved in cell wall biosynthesis